MVQLKPFKSTTLEGAFLEAAFILEKLETAINYSQRKAKELYELQEATRPPEQKEKTPKTFTETSFINVTVNTDEQKCNIVVTLPIVIKQNSFGGYLLAREVLDLELIATNGLPIDYFETIRDMIPINDE